MRLSAASEAAFGLQTSKSNEKLFNDPSTYARNSEDVHARSARKLFIAERLGKGRLTISGALENLTSSQKHLLNNPNEPQVLARHTSEKVEPQEGF